MAALLPLPMVPGHSHADQGQLGAYQTQHLAPPMGGVAKPCLFCPFTPRPPRAHAALVRTRQRAFSPGRGVKPRAQLIGDPRLRSSLNFVTMSRYCIAHAHGGWALASEVSPPCTCPSGLMSKASPSQLTAWQAVTSEAAEPMARGQSRRTWHTHLDQ